MTIMSLVLATENDDKSSEEGYAEGQDSDGVSKATPGAVKEASLKMLHGRHGYCGSMQIQNWSPLCRK